MQISWVFLNLRFQSFNLKTFELVFLQNNYDYVVLCKYFSLQIMSLLKYFERESILLHPNGPLSQSVPSSSIAAANKAVEGILSRVWRTPSWSLNSWTLHVAHTSNLLLKSKQESEREPQNMV